MNNTDFIARVRRLNEWIVCVSSNVRVANPSDVRAIALMCLDGESAADGSPHNVWHMSAQFYGTRCTCSPCVKSRR